MKNWKTIILISFIWISCENEEPGIKAKVSPISESVYASGIIKAREQYNVFATVSGILQKVYVNEGDTIKKGAPLFLIENQTAALNTENAKLALALTEENIKNNSNRQKELELAAENAKEKLQLDSLMYTRYKNLWEQNAGTKVSMDQAKLAYETSKANYHAAVRRYDQAQIQFRTEYEQAKNNLKINNEIQKNYTIRSEVDGLVYDILKEQGELITNQSPIAILGKTENFLITLEVDEYDIVRVKPGQEILVSMDSYKGQVFKGKVSKIYPIMNERSRTFTVEAIFTEAPKELYPNLTVEANIIIKTKKNALIIPREYLLEGKYVLNDADEKIKVEVGLSDYEYVEIVSGLDSSQYIIKP